MGVPYSQLTTNFIANYQLTTVFLAKYQLTANPNGTLYVMSCMLTRSIRYCHMDHNAPCLPPKFCITIVSNFSRALQDNACAKF